MFNIGELSHKAWSALPEAKNLAKHKKTCLENRRKRKNKRKKK